MNFNGQHFDIRTFSGVDGQKTPSWTPYIFQWSQISNYYLAEAQSQAGDAVKSLHIGSEVVVNGRTLHVTQILPNMDRVNSYDTVVSMASQHAIGIQTCVNASGSIVATYWAD
ncbi:cell wall binding repeat protein [Fructobacillus pseudoficulneus]|uniref:Cell wall binding repeat protein n=1 Tax=Fructobacillus pseudoficulneus TaxID=220714 RepID=A0A3F3GSD6_9LACO|nr:hypothetical protein [Fructobacillus pseudoficulneus]GAP02514.1 cell wall binding repeat protein [Fructobacillus pseudoficulneus]SEH37350.1 hypothetical protein SAMN05660469_0466 [Fructobacillus pseudoficulneus]